MKRYYTIREKMLILSKKNKKVATRQSIIASIICLVLILTIGNITLSKVAIVDQDEDAVLTISMVGDMTFGRFVENVTDRRGFDFLFKYAQPYFETSDIVTGNFNNPILVDDLDTYEMSTQKRYHFSTNIEALHALERANFSNVSLANTSILDFGENGLLDTMTAFSNSEQVQAVGAGRNINRASRAAIEEISGIKVATLGFSDVYYDGTRSTDYAPGILPADPDVSLPLISRMNHEADLVIVHIHWGREFNSSHSKRQEELGRAFVDAGADIVIGHNPHVLMSAEVYNDSIIFYSLGNFIFDQGWSRTRDSIIAQYKIYNDGLARIELVPFRIYEAQPRSLNGFSRWYHESKIFRQITKDAPKNNNWFKEDGKLVIELDHSHVFSERY